MMNMVMAAVPPHVASPEAPGCVRVSGEQHPLVLTAGTAARLARLTSVAAAVVAMLLAPTGVLAQDVLIRGIAQDSAGHPIPFANIDVEGLRRTVADDSGHFSLSAAAGQELVIDIRRIGFRRARLVVVPVRDTTLRIVLAPTAAVLPGQTIAATQPRKSLVISGFYRRMLDREKFINAGYFVTEEDIERRNPSRITQMLEGFPTVRVIRFNTQLMGNSVVGRPILHSQCYRETDPDCLVPAGVNRCPMTVYVDGRRINSLSAARTQLAYAFGLDGIVQPSAVAGIEIYTTPGRVPPEYQMLAGTCGAILMWTK